MKLSQQTILILVFLFLISILVRLPLLNRPLSKHHEFCTAIALRIIASWQENGIKNLKFKPAANFGRTEDKFINNYASASGKMIDAQGNYYYVSHPPLGYYLPFGIFQLFGIKADVLPLQVFHLFIHFLCGVGVFLIVSNLYPKENELNFAAILAYAVYLFNPATLWFQSNVYMSDMVVQLPFIFAVLVCTKMLLYEHHLLKRALILLLLCFSMVYTSWLGVFFCIAAVILIFRGKLMFSLALIEILFTALVLGLGIAFLQYSKIAGIENLKEELACRFAQRSSIHGWQTFLSNIFGVLKNYFFNYAAMYMFLAGSVLSVYLIRKRIRMGAILRNVLAISVLPIVLLHLVLSDYSGHDFTVLYAALPFSIFAGFLAERLYGHVSLKYLVFGIGIFLSLNIVQFYYINRPGAVSQSGERYNVLMNEGIFIKKYINADEIVFALNYKPSPETIWYAHVNIKTVSSEAEAKTFLKARARSKGIVFFKNEKNNLEFFRINAAEIN